MQRAGSEKTRKKANTDGDPGSTGLLPDKLDIGKLQSAKENGSIVEYLDEIGLDRKVAKRILRANGLSEKMLDRRVVAGVMSGELLNSIERMSMQQKYLVQITRRKPIVSPDGKVKDDTFMRISAASASAALSTSIARMVETLIKDASSQGVPDNPNATPPGAPTINMQFNMPPVANPVKDANNGSDV